MTSKLRGAVAAAFVVAASLAGIEGARAEVVVTAGRSVTLMTLAAIDQVCHSQGPVTVNVLVPPQGGFLEVVQVKAFPNFNALNTRSRCNTLKLPATQVVYQSAGTFLGLDYVTVEVIFPEGGVRRIRVPISVRPVTPGDAALPNASASALAPSGQAVPDVAVVPARPKPVRHAKRPVVTAQAAHRRELSRAAPPVVPAAPPVPKPLFQNI